MDWVICAGMKRSGSTVQYQLVSEVVERSDMGRRIGYVLPDEFSAVDRDLASEQGLAVAKSHDFIPLLEEKQFGTRVRVVYVFRDIRDVVVSMMADQNREFYRLLLSGDLSAIIHQGELWRSWNHVLVSRYEEMTNDLPGEVVRISAFLGAHVQRKQAEEIAADFSLEAQQARIREFDFENQGYRKDGTLTVVDPVTNLHRDHIRSGKAGRWKADLNPVQSALLECLTSRWLLANGYRLSHGWTGGGLGRLVGGLIQGAGMAARLAIRR